MVREVLVVTAVILGLGLGSAQAQVKQDDQGSGLSGRVGVDASTSVTFIPLQEIDVTANCPLGKVVLGGGYSYFLPSGGCTTLNLCDGHDPHVQDRTAVFTGNLAAPTSLTWETLNTTCGVNHATFEFFLNGVSLGTAQSDPNETCICQAPVDTFVVSDASLIASLWNVSGDNTFRFTSTGNDAHITWTRVNFDSTSVCVFDQSNQQTGGIGNLRVVRSSAEGDTAWRATYKNILQGNIKMVIGASAICVDGGGGGENPEDAQ